MIAFSNKLYLTEKINFLLYNDVKINNERRLMFEKNYSKFEIYSSDAAYVKMDSALLTDMLVPYNIDMLSRKQKKCALIYKFMPELRHYLL